MEKISKGIVFSNDIDRILSGVNAFNYNYKVRPSSDVVRSVRKNFKGEVNEIFDDVLIISEDEMLEVNKFVGGEYPHCIFR